MELSALTVELSRIKAKRIHVEVKTNYKKFYGTYPHVVRLLLRRPNEQYAFSEKVMKQCRALKDALVAGMIPWEYHVRREWYYFNIFCMDPAKVLASIKHTFREIESVTVEQMSEDVLEESSIKPELPRAQTRVVSRLPHKKYRYRAYWPMTKRVMTSIGRDALEGIVAQINADPTCKPIKQKTVNDILRMGYQYNSRYFYAEDENIFCIISLINPRFIEKIEKFVTLEELNAKTTSRSTDQ